MHPKVYLAIPLMDEFQNISNLINDIKKQDYANFDVVFCVNQPDSWWTDTNKVSICENNRKTINFLKKVEIGSIIDKSGKGNGWDSKNYGVGWARKTIMDSIAKNAEPNDIILTLDGDTRIKTDYISSVVNTINNHSKAVALSIPYYHPLTEDEETNRNILRYEIYMRYYSLNLYRIKNPYHFTALGSAIAVPVWAYKRVRGITPHKSGEDFYFLLKLKKFGNILNWNPSKVYPEARYSDRVFFGTGPAMIKGREGNWSSYPIYNYQLFDDIKKSFNAFNVLFKSEANYPMKSFLSKQFNDDEWHVALRKNNKTAVRFYKACTDKVDALRILQYLKSNNENNQDESNLLEFMNAFYPDNNIVNSGFDFLHTSVHELNELRNYLVEKEEIYQQHAQ